MTDFIIFLILLFSGLIIGSILEKKHFKSLQKREKKLLKLPCISIKKPVYEETIVQSEFISSSVVISIDYFKKFIAKVVNFFGGNIIVYDSLLNRAKREAILKLKENAKNASEIINLKIETVAINRSSKSVGTIEVIAYATAIYR